jgi:hypothetical protein
MAGPEHIRHPIRRVLTVIYTGRKWDEAIDAELQRQGKSENNFDTIIAIPEISAPKGTQLDLFD